MARVTRTLASLVDVMESIAPTRWAQSWDNVGLLVGDPAAPLRRVLVANDASPAVIDECVGGGFDALLAYHPVIFSGLKRVTAGSAAWSLIRAGVGVYSPHTALDVADGGTSDVLADVVGMTDRAPVRVTVPAEGRGLGRVGAVGPIERSALIAAVKRGLGVERLLVAGPTEGEVTRAAVGAGACGDLVDDVLRAGAGLYLTGEMRHHDALKAASAGLTVVAALHSNSERVTLARLAERVRGALPEVDVALSKTDRDPFAIV